MCFTLPFFFFLFAIFLSKWGTSTKCGVELYYLILGFLFWGNACYIRVNIMSYSLLIPNITCLKVTPLDTHWEPTKTKIPCSLPSPPNPPKPKRKKIKPRVQGCAFSLYEIASFKTICNHFQPKLISLPNRLTWGNKISKSFNFHFQIVSKKFQIQFFNSLKTSSSFFFQSHFPIYYLSIFFFGLIFFCLIFNPISHSFKSFTSKFEDYLSIFHEAFASSLQILAKLFQKLASILPKSSRFHWFKKFNLNYLQYFNTTFKIHIESHSFYFHIHEPIIRFNISSSGNIYNCWDQNHGLLPKCPYIQMKTILILCSKIHILILNLSSKNTHSSFN
jgi:hypothetical protein